MGERKTISIDEAAFERLEAHKQEGESWPEFADRVADVLESGGQGGECESNALTEEHIDDIVTRSARKTADEVQNRLTGR